MARKIDQQGGFKAITATAAQTITFSPSELIRPVRGASLVAFHLAFRGSAGADTTTANINRVRVQSNGLDLWNVTYPELRSYLEEFYWSNTEPGASAYQFTIPFFMLDAKTEDEMDTCAFPLGADPTLIVDFASAGAGAGAGLGVAWTLSDVVPKDVPYLYGRGLNFGTPGAGTTNRVKYDLQENGLLRGLGFNLQGVAEYLFQIDTRQKLRCQNRSVIVATAANHGSLFTEVDAFRGPNVSGVSGGGAATNSGFHIHKLVGMLQGTLGSYVELLLNENWAGTGNEMLVYALRPQPQISQ